MARQPPTRPARRRRGCRPTTHYPSSLVWRRRRAAATDAARRERKASKAALKAEGQSAGLEGVSLNIFGPESAFRQHCLTIAEAGWFDAFIIWIIIASSICLALDVPRLDPTSELKGWLVLLNEVFTVIFILEMAIKVLR